MASIIIINDKGRHIQTWGISDREIQGYFELIMAKWEWDDNGRKNYLEIMEGKSISEVLKQFGEIR